MLVVRSYQTVILRTYVKFLSAKHDNDKNQIYLRGALDGVTILFPAMIGSSSQSTISLTFRTFKHLTILPESLRSFM